MLYVIGVINPLNAELNPGYHLLALLGAHHIFRVRGLRVNMILNISQTVIKIFAEFEMWLVVFCNFSRYLGFLGILTYYSIYLLLRAVVNELFLLTPSTVL